MISPNPSVLIVEDDVIVYESLCKLLFPAQVLYSDTGQDVLPLLKQHVIDVVFVDLFLPHISGHEIIHQIQAYDSCIEIIVISSSSEIDDVISAFRSGISEYIRKPLNPDYVSAVFQKSLAKRKLTTENRSYHDFFSDLDNQFLVGDSLSMQHLHRSIDEISGYEVDVLISGESGVGKELVAKTLHRKEKGKDRPYITLNCSAIPENLIESVLFGHEKGSFTGAVKRQIGKFELANGGDIFLDEVSTLPLNLQAKLLRVIQEREIDPIGLGYSKKLKFRIIAATNEDLSVLVENKLFRKDLYYRLNKFVITIPPLREHLDDIDSLTGHFLRKHARRGKVKTVSNQVLEIFKQYHWPGNIRELENTIENLVITSAGDIINSSDLHHLTLSHSSVFNTENPCASKGAPASESDNSITITLNENKSLSEALKQLEQTYIKMVLERSTSKTKAAQDLGLDRRTLYRKIKYLNIST